jgi:tetratricopeptide (TPR) repeat protein
MVVVDTGSRDETPKIAKSLGARVFHFPWSDSFAAARNESLRHAQGEWLFWMDSDDTISAENGRKLRQLVAGPHHQNCLGYIIQVHCPAPQAGGAQDVTVVDHVKLFRNRRSLQFEHRIHEQVLPSIRRAGGEVTFTDIFVVHSGADHTPDGRRRKLLRDLKLLELELAERPDHPFALFNLGMTYADDGRHDEAVRVLQRSLEVAHPAESHVRKIYALLASSLWQLGEYESAQEACETGLRLFPKDPELLFRAGMLHQHLGQFSEAAIAYEAALANDDAPHFSSIDRGIIGYKARQNLAVAYASMGDLERAISQWRLMVEELPDHRDGWSGLFDALLKHGNLSEAAVLAEKLSRHPQLRPVGLLAVAQVLRANRELEMARQSFEAVRDEFPDDPEVQRAWCEFLYHHDSIEAAEAALVQLVRLAPDDASARHNLGVVHANLGRMEEAEISFEEARRLRGARYSQRTAQQRIATDLAQQASANGSARKTRKKRRNSAECVQKLK